jgi:hypothetical protein
MNRDPITVAVTKRGLLTHRPLEAVFDRNAHVRLCWPDGPGVQVVSTDPLTLAQDFLTIEALLRGNVTRSKP